MQPSALSKSKWKLESRSGPGAAHWGVASRSVEGREINREQGKDMKKERSGRVEVEWAKEKEMDGRGWGKNGWWKGEHI